MCMHYLSKKPELPFENPEFHLKNLDSRLLLKEEMMCKHQACTSAWKQLLELSHGCPFNWAAQQQGHSRGGRWGHSNFHLSLQETRGHGYRQRLHTQEGHSPTAW